MEIYFLTVIEAGSPRSRYQSWLPLRPLSLACRWHLLLLCLHMVFLLCAHIAGVSLCVLISSSSKDTSQIGLGSTHMILFNLNYLFKALFPSKSHAEVLGVRAYIYEFWGGHDSAHNRYQEDQYQTS